MVTPPFGGKTGKRPRLKSCGFLAAVCWAAWLLIIIRLNDENAVKYEKIINLIVPPILAPLWLALLVEPIKQNPRLLYPAISITTLLLIIYFVVLIHELRIKLDSHFNWQRRKIDRLIDGTQKKLQKIIAGTGDRTLISMWKIQGGNGCMHGW
jgi:hypothetical protein